MSHLLKYFVLPREISAFEANYLQRMNRVGIAFFAVHIPVLILIAWANGTGPLLAAALSATVLAGPALAYATLPNPRAISVLYGIAAMFMGGLLVHFGQGPMQIEMHFYFFALIAMLAVFGNPLVIVAAAVTVTLHHLIVWMVLPRSVFNYDASLWVVAVHAAFVVLVSIAACFIARSFFDNVIGLERIVQARTAELDGRNHAMRLVLDNVAQGFVAVDRNGVLSAERSCALDQWFGVSGADATIFDLFANKSPEFADLSRLYWSEVTEAVMPLELTLAQMPKDLAVANTVYRVAYVPIGEGQTPARFLVVVTDVTAEVVGERSERDRREEMNLFERLLGDRLAFGDFFDEGRAMVDALTGTETPSGSALKRMLHTLKGNSAIFGLESLSSVCHDLETYVAEEGTAPPAFELAKLRERWDRLTSSLERLMGVNRHVIEIDESEHAALEQAVRRGVPSTTLLNMVHSLKLEPTQRRLQHFGEQVERIATRLGKDVSVRVEAHDLRVDPRHWAPFWAAFIHPVRNAVDHGLETPDVRERAGKPPQGFVALRTCVRGDRFVIEVVDDGRGIDWRRIADKAGEMGLPSATEEELRAAIFEDGVSTATHVTDLSGRGIGMGALRAATASLGGELAIETRPGLGTTLRMTFPTEWMAPALRVAKSGAPPTVAA
jgi:two-component system chemotaxis sensor kinase CheA